MLALAPGVGDVDILLASELLEAGRAIAAGFVTPDRTLVIASTARSYLVVEKMAMGDGRYDHARLVEAVEHHSQVHLLLDMEALAKQSGALVNAVMLGALAGCGRLPIPAEALEAAIRGDGKATDANLRGFRAGLAAAREGEVTRPEPGSRGRGRAASLAELEGAIAIMPEPARDVVSEGARRLVAYQDLGYAQLYLDRLRPIGAADEHARAGGRLLRETARHLAVRMSYEDVIRVAQAKIDPARMRRIAAEIGVKSGEPFTVTEFLKPGIEEMCSILPPSLARRDSRPRRTARMAGARALGDGSQQRVGVGFSALLAAGQTAPLAAEILPVPGGTGRDRVLAALDHGCRSPFRRPRARSRGMRAADQGLRRHLEARHRQLPSHREARHRSGAGRSNSTAARRRRRRERARGGARRSRRRNARALPRRAGAAGALNVAAE